VSYPTACAYLGAYRFPGQVAGGFDFAGYLDTLGEIFPNLLGGSPAALPTNAPLGSLAAAIPVRWGKSRGFVAIWVAFPVAGPARALARRVLP
jgi:hypothetical protein